MYQGADFSEFVQMRRAADAARVTGTDTSAHSLTHTAQADPAYYMCCGTSSVLTIWRPRAGEIVFGGGGSGGGGGLGAVEVHVWGAFLPAGRVRVDVAMELSACPAPLRIGLGAGSNGKVSVWGLLSATHETRHGENTANTADTVPNAVSNGENVGENAVANASAAAAPRSLQIAALLVTEGDGREQVEEELDRISVLLPWRSAEACVSPSQTPLASHPQPLLPATCHVMVGVAADSFRDLFHLDSLAWPLPAPLPPHLNLPLAWYAVPLDEADAGVGARGGKEEVGTCMLACQRHARCIAGVFVAASRERADGGRCGLLLQASEVGLPTVSACVVCVLWVLWVRVACVLAWCVNVWRVFQCCTSVRVHSQFTRGRNRAFDPKPLKRVATAGSLRTISYH
jgi:ribosomal protein S27AE